VIVAERDLVPRGGLQPSPFQQGAAPPAHTGPSSLADILERVLDKGIVIAGDIQINLLEIELLTIKLRLLIASVDRAREMGINWWESDPSLSSETKQLEEENQSLRERLERLEQRVGLPTGEDDAAEAGESAPAQRKREKR
jgi:hypothetical protein